MFDDLPRTWQLSATDRLVHGRSNVYGVCKQSLWQLAFISDSGLSFGVSYHSLLGKISKQHQQPVNETVPVLLHIFVKGVWTTDGKLRLRGQAFAVSTEMNHYSISKRHISQSPAAHGWTPSIWLAHEKITWQAEVGNLDHWYESNGKGEARFQMPFR